MKIKIFYDAKCSLCNKEINIYKRQDTKNKFDWIDINKDKKVLQKYNLKYIDTQKVFHVINKDGTLKKSVDAFLVIWKELKYWKILYFIINKPIIKQIAQILYKYFAKRRFNNLECSKSL